MTRNILASAGLAAALLFSAGGAQAQDIHFTQFEAAPLVINPAFTGGHNGLWRAAGIYRNQWRSVTIPYVTYGASFDMPLITDLSTDDYLAGGIQLFNDKAGDANLSNFSALASVAYTKFLGRKVDKSISIGVQGGYTQKSIDLSKLYFADEFVGGTFMGGTSAEYPYLNNKVDYFTLNAGVAWSHAPTQKFGYTIGLGANNLNQPQESFRKKANSDVGLAMRYNAQVGAILYTSERFSIRPAVLYQSQATATELIGGSEFHYIVGSPEFRSIATAVFLGGWYRTGDAAMITGGIEFKGFRLGLSYDYNTSALKSASNGNGGFEISLRYIAPNPLDFARRLLYPCARF